CSRPADSSPPRRLPQCPAPATWPPAAPVSSLRAGGTGAWRLDLRHPRELEVVAQRELPGDVGVDLHVDVLAVRRRRDARDALAALGHIDAGHREGCGVADDEAV